MSNPTPTPASLLNDESFLQYCLYPDGDEALAWRRRRSDDPALDTAAGQALLLFAAIQNEAARTAADQAAAEFERLFHAGNKPEAPVLSAGVVRKKWLSAAAAAIGLLVATWWLLQGPAPSAPTAVGNAAPATENPTQTAWHTGLEGRRKIQLPDGTLVTLNYNSALQTEPAYNTDQRTVVLEGEAYFEVAHDSARPFIVKAGNTATQALGTAFLVRAYSAEKTVNVLLHNGKVKITEMSAGTETVLLPGEQFTGKMAGKPVKKPFETARLEYWTAETLIFENATPEQIARKLEQYYGVGVRLENTPRHAKHFSGRFKNEPLEKTLNVIGLVQGFEFSVQKETILIRFKR
jgi:transmembrane sensor